MPAVAAEGIEYGNDVGRDGCSAEYPRYAAVDYNQRGRMRSKRYLQGFQRILRMNNTGRLVMEACSDSPKVGKVPHRRDRLVTNNE